MNIAYKPFHNQFKKKATGNFFEQLVSKALTQWLNHTPAHYPGRFTATHPAGVELHVTMDLLAGVDAHGITNLSRTDFSAAQIIELYSLRWQIELLFKEWKSYNHLKTTGTAQPHLVKTLIWASVLCALLKRVITYSVMGMCQVCLSTQKAARSAPDWLPTLLTNLFSSSIPLAEATLTHTATYLEKHARRANMKRDKDTALFKYGCHPAMNF